MRTSTTTTKKMKKIKKTLKCEKCGLEVPCHNLVQFLMYIKQGWIIKYRTREGDKVKSVNCPSLHRTVSTPHARKKAAATA